MSDEAKLTLPPTKALADVVAVVAAEPACTDFESNVTVVRCACGKLRDYRLPCGGKFTIAR